MPELKSNKAKMCWSYIDTCVSGSPIIQDGKLVGAVPATRTLTIGKKRNTKKTKDLNKSLRDFRRLFKLIIRFDVLLPVGHFLP